MVDYYFPGADLVDIAGHNFYDDDWMLAYDTDAIWRRYGKVFAVPQAGKTQGQTGNTNWSNITYLSGISNTVPRCSFFCVWNGFLNVYYAISDNAHAWELMNDPWVATRDEVKWRYELPFSLTMELAAPEQLLIIRKKSFDVASDNSTILQVRIHKFFRKPFQVWTAMAHSLKEGDGGRHLMTFHPFGGGHSSAVFHYSDWLDFNMIQSGHTPTSANYSRIQMDYNLRPPKPCMDSEPAYEYPPDAIPPNRPVGALEVRRRAYWALFSGEHGHTYGTHPIWQMYAPPRQPLWDVKTPWYDAMDLLGAKQLAHVKALLFSRPFLTSILDQLAIFSDLRGGLEYVSVTRDDLAQTLGEFPKQQRMDFSAPTKSATKDCILELDDAAKQYPAPGVAVEQRRDHRP